MDLAMQKSSISNRAIVTLLVVAFALPITICVVLGVGALLQAMGDTCGGDVLNRVALGLGIAWGIDLICLVLLLAIHSLHGPGGSDGIE